MADPLFGVAYPPAGAMISGGAEGIGLGQTYAFALFNLAWAGGQVVGSAGSASLAQATSDIVPYALLAALCIGTVIAVRRTDRRVRLTSSALIVYFLLALGYFDLKDLDKSEAGVRQALALNPKTPQAYTLLANIDFARGSVERGKGDLRTAIAANMRASSTARIIDSSRSEDA